MIELIFAAARKAAPAAYGRTRYDGTWFASASDLHPGVLSREELRRAVAEVIG